MKRHRSTLDLLALTRRRLVADMLATSPTHRVPLMVYGAALYALKMARDHVRQANRELGRPVTLTRTVRRKRRVARIGAHVRKARRGAAASFHKRNKVATHAQA